MSMLLFALLLLTVCLYCLIIYSNRFQQSVAAAPRFTVDPAAPPPAAGWPRVSVIIPAYNETDNIRDCVTAVLDSTDLPADRLEVWVVDDQSTDDTWTILQAVDAERADPRLHLLAGQSRPQGEVWVGKNWACTQAVAAATGEYLLFLDADVRLRSRAIEAALTIAQRQQSGLLTLWPALTCGCLAEWVIQPLILGHLVVAFNFAAVNDPTSDTVFAAGPFMLFQRSAYETVGGHRAMASQVVEDVELGRRVKQLGLGLCYGLGRDLAAVRMYRSWGALWEGWTKNFYLGAQRNLWLMLYLALIMVLVYPLPWLAWLGLGVAAIAQPFTPIAAILTSVGFVLGVTAIALHYNLRQTIYQVADCPTRYWWLSSIGGTLIAAIAIGSIIKTETGWGWTWRGRQLGNFQGVR